MLHIMLIRTLTYFDVRTHRHNTTDAFNCILIKDLNAVRVLHENIVEDTRSDTFTQSVERKSLSTKTKNYLFNT